MDIWFNSDLYGIVGVALIWASKVSTNAISVRLQFVWYKSALALSLSSQGLNDYWSIFRDGINTRVDGYYCPILIEYWQTNFHLEFRHKWMLVVCVLRRWKFCLEFIYGHIYAIIVIRVILLWEILFNSVVPQSTWLSQVIEWLVYNYMLRFFILD